MYNTSMNSLFWNPLYEITALTMIVLFITFYNMQRTLPTRKNLQFAKILSIELVCIIFNLVSTYATTYPQIYPAWILHFTNQVYFICLSSIYYAFYAYCRFLAEESKNSYKPNLWIFRIPLWVIITLLLINPLTGWIFKISEDGYSRGILYKSVLVPYQLFYLILGLVFVLKSRKSILLKERNCIYCFCFIIFIGTIFQGYVFQHWLLINNFLTIGFAILFLSTQNPEYVTDSKTKLFNVDAFIKYSEELIHRKKHFNYIAFTFSNFKTAISVYGQDNIDELLMHIGSTVLKKFRKNPSFYIHNGKFVIAINSKDSEKQLQSKLKKTFEEPFKIGNITLNNMKFRLVSLNFNKNISSGNELLSILETALDYVTSNDLSTMEQIDDDLISKTKENQKIKRALHKAIAQNSLVVYYQPIFDSHANKVSSAEALVRIFDPEIGLIQPNYFISLAEEDETILNLGMQVLRKVCEFIKTHDMEALGLNYIEVNLSPIQCMHKNLADDIINITKEYDVDLSYLNFEITESSMVNIEEVKKMMTKLIDAGASFSLDDYGTGFSNLINVLKLPLKIIKIDKSIVNGYFISKQGILPKIVSMFHDEGFDVLAEGVETEPQKEGINSMNCRYIQGFYYSKPLPQEKFIEYLQENNNANPE